MVKGAGDMSKNQATQKILKAFKEDESIISVERKNNSVVVTYQLKEELQQPKEDTSTYTVKLDSKQVYKVMKNAVDKYNRELEKETNKQNYMICNYMKDGIVFVAKHIIIANEKDMKQMKEKFNEIDWIEIEL